MKRNAFVFRPMKDRELVLQSFSELADKQIEILRNISHNKLEISVKRSEILNTLFLLCPSYLILECLSKYSGRRNFGDLISHIKYFDDDGICLYALVFVPSRLSGYTRIIAFE